MHTKTTGWWGSVFRILLLAATTSILGCIEEESECTINPDLSGKVALVLTFVPWYLEQAEPGEAPEELLKPQIESILRRSRGVDVWKDISFELTDEGSARFKGTAYFPDVNKVKLWTREQQEGVRLEFSKDSSGRLIIKSPDSGAPETKINDKGAIPLSEAEVARQLKLAKLQYNNAKPMLVMTLANFEQDVTLRLPGKIEEISVFEKTDDSTAHWKIHGNEIIEAMETLMADEEGLKRLIREGKNPFGETPDESLFNELFLGKQGRIQIISSANSRDLFDYASEVAAARSAYDRMLRDLGLDPTVEERVKAPTVSRAQPRPGTVRVVGVNLIKYHDHERGIRPLHRGSGYTLSLLLELEEPHLAITHGRVEKAVTDTGQDILRPDTGISSPRLTKYGKGVVFEFTLATPDKDARGLAELSGVLVFLGSSGTKEIDLGVMEFKEGAKGAVPGFSIEFIEPDWREGYTKMDLGVDLLLGTLKSTKFYLEDGTELNVSQTSKSFASDKLKDVDYRIKGEFPAKGRIVLEVLDDVTNHEIAFKLTNISLLGDPL
jgi:hypothetical protein